MDLSIVIPARPKDQHLDRVLDSIQRQKDMEIEILVVFNPTLPAWFRKNVRIFSAKGGANAARNVGLRNARSDLILFLDSDCELLGADSLAERVSLMRKNLDWVAAGGGYKIPANSNRPTRAYSFLQNDWIHSNIQNSDLRCPFLLGGNMLLRKSLLRGMEFDENLIFGGTEKEFFCRLQGLNSNIYFIPQWTIKHLISLTVEELCEKASAQGAGSKYILEKGVNFNPKMINVRAEQPAKELLPYIELYHEAYDRSLKGENWRKSISLKQKFQTYIHGLIEKIDITIGDIGSEKDQDSHFP